MKIKKELSDEDKETIANMYRLKIEITRVIINLLIPLYSFYVHME